MKKIAVLLVSLFMFCTSAYSQTPIDFLYIHGADQGTADEFNVWINRMHPDMMKNLPESELIQEQVLKDAYINKDPQMYYWADKTGKGRAAIKKGLDISKIVTPSLSHCARSLIAYMLHDAIWLQRYSNIRPLLDDINAMVIKNHNKGEKTILCGYSAGSLITYQYMLNKAKTINLATFARIHRKDLKLKQEQVTYLEKYADELTCIDAIVDAKIGILSADGGLIINPNREEARKNLRNLKRQTQLSCTPDNAISGVINFGSPLLVFYSNIGEEHTQLQYFTHKMGSSIIENGQFFMTVNYTRDPIGVPMENITYAQSATAENVKNGNGFIYHTSVPGGLNFIAGHLKYWDQTNHFTKEVAKSYDKGYKLFYGK